MARFARAVRAASDLAPALAAVTRARRRVARTPVGGLIHATSPLPEAAGAALQPDQRQIAERWAAAVDRTLRWTPGDSACLVRASALRDLVAARGLPRATVRIGVRRSAEGFTAHAWVEQDGAAIAEPVELRGAFASLDGVTLR